MEKVITEVILKEEVKNEFEISLLSAVDCEIERLDKFQVRILELQKIYSSVDILDINDKAGFDKTKEALFELRKLRVNTDKDRKSIKAPLLAAGKSIEGKAQWIISEIEKIEEPLIAKKDWYEAAKEKEKQEKIEKESARLKVRVNQLQAMGATLDGISVNLNHVSFDMELIRSSHEEIYVSKILPRYQEVFEANEIIRKEMEEAQRLIDEDNRKKEEEIKAAQQKIKGEQERLQKEEARIAKEKKDEEDRVLREKAAEARKKLKERYEALDSLGADYKHSTGRWEFGDSSVDSESVTAYDEKEWADLLETVAKKMEEHRLKQKEEHEAFIKRSNDAAIQADEARKSIAAETERKRQREELENSKDADRWVFFLKKLHDVDRPVMTGWRYRKIMEAAEEKLNEIKNMKAIK